jgi:hypothetical protein
VIVVSDAGPLIYLGSVGRLALLQDLFGRVVVPQQASSHTRPHPLNPSRADLEPGGPRVRQQHGPELRRRPAVPDRQL